MAYFVMACTGEYPSASMESCPDLPGPGWLTGQRVSDNVATPMRYTLDADRPGNLCAMYDDMVFPIMSDELVEALLAAGVDNLELFDAVVEDPTSGTQHSNYKAFNVVGVVAAADMDASKTMGISDSSKIDVDFDSLAIDEGKASGHRLFRLAENVSAIIVDDAVKKEVERRGIPGMTFYDPADWSG